MKHTTKLIDENPVQQLYLQLLQLSPIAIVSLVLWPSNDAMLTLLCFHVISMVVLPLLYCNSYGIDINSLLSNQSRNLKKQVQVGSIMGILGLIGMVVCFQLYVGYFGEQFILGAKIPVQFNWFYLNVFFFMFSVINPVVEELFWRILVEHETEKTELGKWTVAFYYGLYHFFVIDYVIRDAVLALILTCCVVILGRILSHMKEKYGLYATIIAHAGVDAGLCAVLYETSMYFMH